MQSLIVVVNVAAAALVVWLMGSGVVNGLLRYQQRPVPEWLASGGWVFATAGFALALSLTMLLVRWAPLLMERSGRSELRDPDEKV